MKKVRLTVVMLFVALATGCEPQSSVRPEQMQNVATQVADLAAKLDDYQASADTVLGQLSQYGVVDANLMAKAQKLNKEIDRVQPQVAAIAEAIRTADISGNDLEAWVKMAGAANAASAPVNPYAPFIAGGLGILDIILAWFVKRKSDEAKANALKYQAHKQGVELTMKQVSLDDNTKAVEEDLYRNIGNARTALGVK